MAIVHDFVADIDGLAILIERLFHDIDGADDPGTEAARLGKNNSHHDPLCATRLAPGAATAATQQKAVSRIGGAEINPCGKRVRFPTLFANLPE